MKKKLIFSGILLIALVLTTGAFAYTYSGFATATLDVTPAGSSFFTSEEAPTTEQPDWESLMPEAEYSLEILRPNAAGDETNIPFQSPSSGEHWDKVDDESPDDGDTYVNTWQANNYCRDLYNLTDHVEGSGNIQFVTVYFTFSGYTDGGDYSARARAAIKTHETVYEGSVETTTGDTFVTGAYQWTVNPGTGSQWTWDEIDNLQAGINLRGQSRFRPAFCTQVYIVVGYEMPPIIDGAVPKGDLFTVTPHGQYTGDFQINLYLTNTGYANLAYRHLNIKLYVGNSLEAGKSPHYQVLSLENGVATFNIEGGAAASYTVEVIGGGYNLTSADPDEWGEGWSITPEFYCEVIQR